MSIETDLSRIANALEQLASTLSNKATTVAAPVTVVQPAPVTVAPVVAPAPVPNVHPVVAAPVVVPPIPTAPAPVPTPVPTTAATSPPFGKQEDGTDHTIVTYVMATYRALGPINGAKIQGVLTGLGYTNINEVKPEHYAQFQAGVEALKVAA